MLAEYMKDSIDISIHNNDDEDDDDVLSSASEGDKDWPYRGCVFQCTSDYCQRNSNEYIPLYARMFFWTCHDECSYNCMHKISNDRFVMKLPALQYHGKWPFYRFLGIQEPASVLFSLGNLYTHFQGLQRFRMHIPSRYHLRYYLIGYSVASMNAWIWSSIYHSRDFFWTESMDYISGAGHVLFSAMVALIRLFDSHRSKSVLPLICGVLFVFHVVYLLSNKRFDYNYNMKATVFVGSASLFAWIGVAIKIHRIYMWRCVFVAVSLAVLLPLLELSDFPPLYGVFDAHAIWHLCTIPLNWMWYTFLIEDSQYYFVEVDLHDCNKNLESSPNRIVSKHHRRKVGSSDYSGKEYFALNKLHISP